MKTGMTALCVAGGLLALIFVAGFFHEGRSAAKRTEAPCAPALEPSTSPIPKDPGYGKYEANRHNAGEVKRPAAALPLLDDRAYKLQGECTMKVKAVLEMEESLKGLLTEHKGTIEQLEITGTERGRDGFAVLSVPSDRFDPFVKAVRGLGTMERERISAVAWKPAGNPSGDSVPEWAVVTLRFSDIASSPAVDESKGILATSFGRSASHFLKGIAVLVEAVGFVLPFLVAAILLFGPAFVVVKITRRLRASRAVAHSA